MPSNGEGNSRQVAKTQMKDIQETFSSLVRFMFNVLGIEESMHALEAKNIDMQPSKALNLSYAELNQYAAIHQQAITTVRFAKQRTSNLPTPMKSI